MKSSKFFTPPWLLSAVWLSGAGTWAQAETDSQHFPEPETVFIEESPAPGVVDRARETLDDGLQKLQTSGAAGLKSSREMGGELVDRGQRAVEQGWSSTKKTGADWAEKSVDAGSRAADSVARVTHRSIEAGAEAWESTKTTSSELWQKGQQLGDTVKREIVGIDGPAAEVINKSVPLEP